MLEPLEVHAFDSAATYALDDDAEAGADDRFAGLRYAAEQRVHQPTYSRHVLALEVSVEEVAELIDWHAAQHPVSHRSLLLDLRLLDVVLVADLTNDFLEDVLDRHESRG